MEPRQENALVAPAALLLGAAVLAVFGAVVYFVAGDDDEPLSTGTGGTPPDSPDSEADQIPEDMWNMSVGGTKVASVQAGRTYTANIVVPQLVAGAPFSVNVTGDVEYQVGEPEISGIQHMGAVVPVTFTPKTNGSIELVWPEGGVPGEQILNFYRRLDFVVGGGGAIA